MEPGSRHYRIEEVRRIEAAAQATSPHPPLMERAGRVVADAALLMLGSAPDRDPVGRTVLLLAGPGNNGGDALVAARLLREAGCVCIVILAGDESRLPAGAGAALAAWRAAGGGLATQWPDNPPDLIIDGLLGIGIRRAPEGLLAGLIRRANACGVPVLAIDVPSGLDADTGAVLEPAIRAAVTVTFLGDKVGLHQADGPALAGRVVCDWLGCEASVAAI